MLIIILTILFILSVTVLTTGAEGKSSVSQGLPVFHAPPLSNHKIFILISRLLSMQNLNTECPLMRITQNQSAGATGVTFLQEEVWECALQAQRDRFVYVRNPTSRATQQSAVPQQLQSPEFPSVETLVMMVCCGPHFCHCFVLIIR